MATNINCAATDVAAVGDTTIGAAIVLNGESILHFEVENGDAAQALDAFKLQVQAYPDGAWEDLVTSWAAATTTLIWYTGALDTCAAGPTEAAIVRVWGVYAIRFRASANGAQADDVTVKGVALP